MGPRRPAFISSALAAPIGGLGRVLPQKEMLAAGGWRYRVDRHGRRVLTPPERPGVPATAEAVSPSMMVPVSSSEAGTLGLSFTTRPTLARRDAAGVTPTLSEQARRMLKQVFDAGFFARRFPTVGELLGSLTDMGMGADSREHGQGTSHNRRHCLADCLCLASLVH